MVSGGANESVNAGKFGLFVESFTTDGVTARSVVRVHGRGIFGGVNSNAPPTFRVTHFYRPSAATTNLYEVNVTIENISSNVVDVLYRRVMDWDIEPTAFREFSTVIKGDSTNLVFTSDDGFASADPLAGPSQILDTGTFIDSGPTDHGARGSASHRTKSVPSEPSSTPARTHGRKPTEAEHGRDHQGRRLDRSW